MRYVRVGDNSITIEQLKKVEGTIDPSSLCVACLDAGAKWVDSKEEEKPNKYAIMHSDTSKWQIIKRNDNLHIWQVEVKDLGSRSNAVLMLDALIKQDKEKN